MAVELDHPFTTAKSLDDNFEAVTDLERVVPAVEGGSVLETTGPDSVKAQIVLKMGAMSMKMVGTIEIVEQDAAAHRAVLKIKARESGGQGHANADEVLRRRDIVFRSTRAETAADGRISMAGDLTLAGTTQPIEFDLAVGDDGALSATVLVTQTRWGMKPYSALFGTLKVLDDVEVVLDGHL